MTPAQKMHAMASLGSTAQINYWTHSKTFYVYLGAPSLLDTDGRVIASSCPHRPTPDEAIDAAWELLTQLKPGQSVRVDYDATRRVRWNGFMWEDVQRN